MSQSIDELLKRVHERIGGLGLDIETWGGDGSVEIRWRRDYDGELSDERFVAAPSLAAGLQAVIDHEDVADGEESEGEW